MKKKLSATIETELLEFLDSLPGDSRSEKLERVVYKFREFEREKELRKRLSQYREDESERAERETWESIVAEAMWRE